MTENLALKDLLALIEDLEKRINAYWNFYTVVVLAVVGWLFTKETGLARGEAWALTIGLTIFFFGNFSVMNGATSRRLSLREIVGCLRRILG